MIWLPRRALVVLPLLILASCKQAEKNASKEDPYMIRMDYLERKLAELRDTTDRRFQDERTRRENQLAVTEKSVRELENRLAKLQIRVEQCETRLSEWERRAASTPAPTPPPNVASAVALSEPMPPLPPVSSPPAVPTTPDALFPLEVSGLMPLVVTVRTQMSVRVIETGKLTRDADGRRIPEVKTETYPIYEYEYRLRFDVSNRASRGLTFQAEAGYGPTAFVIPPNGVLTNRELRWKAGSSLIIRAGGQYRLIPTPPPPPTTP